MLAVPPLPDRGRYRAVFSRRGADIADALGLRARAFGPAGGLRDRFDGLCDHLLVRDMRAHGAPVCCARLRVMAGGEVATHSYSAQFYDLGALARSGARVGELGRFCTDPALGGDPDILRVAWAAITAYAGEHALAMLVGCSSFAGADAAAHADSLALLGARYLAPERWRPARRAPEVVRLGVTGGGGRGDPRAGLRAMPPLLRGYLAMGGRVGDHAVVDRHMDTLHVFTGLEVAAVPERRRRTLGGLAATLAGQAGVDALARAR